MKCPMCNGKGTVLKIIYEDWQKDEIVRSAVKCPRCNGSGEVPMTNEEWLKQCDTEQLAKEIYGFVWCSNELWQQLCCNGDGTDEESDLRIVREWLKQPHTTKE